MSDLNIGDDIIDSRDVIERIEELESDVEVIDEALDEDDYETEVEKLQDLDERDDLMDELNTLKEFAEQCEDYAPDWNYGATLINENYFIDYCEELVKDIGDVSEDVPDYIAIDWAETADNLRIDYTEIEIDNETYLVR